MPISPDDALQRLREGNARFVADRDRSLPKFDADLARGQKPFAIILGCSDSRLPVEIVFNQGFGDLFVIRIAGNIVLPSQIASVEFAVTQFDTRLVVVLGHTNCGAVAAALENAANGESGRTANDEHPILRQVQTAIDTLTPDSGMSANDRIAATVHANVQVSMDKLRSGSPILRELEADQAIAIRGAEYALESGVVHFFKS